MQTATDLRDTPADLDLNRTPPHYDADVPPTKKRPRNAELTEQERASLERVAEAAQAALEAEDALTTARAHRREVLRAEWPTLRALGPTRVAREVGEELLGEGTVRGATGDLRAQDRKRQ